MLIIDVKIGPLPSEQANIKKCLKICNITSLDIWIFGIQYFSNAWEDYKWVDGWVAGSISSDLWWSASISADIPVTDRIQQNRENKKEQEEADKRSQAIAQMSSL